MLAAQKGYILPLVLFGSVAVLSGIGLLLYIFFYRPTQPVALTPLPTPNYTAAPSVISDFESCVKAGNPIMESYPRKCNADGKSYTEIITASPTPEASASAGDVSSWKIYKSERSLFSINYPQSLFTNCNHEGDELFLFEGAEGTRGCGLGEEQTMFYITTEPNSKYYQKSADELCYSVLKEPIKVAEVEANKYYAVIKTSEGRCARQDVAYADAGTHIDLSYDNRNYEIFYSKRVDEEIVTKMLESLKFNP